MSSSDEERTRSTSPTDDGGSTAWRSSPTRPASRASGEAPLGLDAPDPLEYVRRETEAVVDLAHELVSFDTQNPPGETAALVDRLAEVFDALDVRTERVTVERGKPNLLATIPGESDRSLLYAGHTDTVPFDASTWEHDPLGEFADDRLYGRGATDMKGAVAAMLGTARAYVETGTTPPVTLRFAFVSNEETGGDVGMNALLEETDLTADGCVVGETTGGTDRPSIAVADRGHCWLTLEALGNAAHGSRPMLGENAIRRLSEATTDVTATLQGWRPETGVGLEPVIADSVDYYARTLGREVARDLFRHPSVNLGALEGGTAVNIVPDAARARLDVRVPPGVLLSTVLARIRPTLDAHHGVSIVASQSCEGSYTEHDAPVVEATAGLVRRVIGTPVPRRCATGGGDARYLRAAGIPTIEFGFGTDTAHAADEYTTTAALTQDSRVFTALPYAFERHLRADDRKLNSLTELS